MCGYYKSIVPLAVWEQRLNQKLGGYCWFLLRNTSMFINTKTSNDPSKSGQIYFWMLSYNCFPSIQYMTSETQAAEQKQGNKSFRPSLLIMLATMAQLTTWQACLVDGISFLIWKAGAPGKKKNTTEHELSHNVKARKSNLACEFPISDSTMTTGSNHSRTLEWADQPILQSDRHAQTERSDLSFTLKIKTWTQMSGAVLGVFVGEWMGIR